MFEVIFADFFVTFPDTITFRMSTFLLQLTMMKLSAHRRPMERSSTWPRSLHLVPSVVSFSWPHSSPRLLFSSEGKRQLLLLSLLQVFFVFWWWLWMNLLFSAHHSLFGTNFYSRNTFEFSYLSIFLRWVCTNCSCFYFVDFVRTIFCHR